MCRRAIESQQPSNLYRVLNSLKLIGDKRHLKNVLRSAQRKLFDREFCALSTTAMSRRAAWASSYTICRLFFENMSNWTHPPWASNLSKMPLLQVLLFHLRAHPAIVDAIWRMDLMADASL